MISFDFTVEEKIEKHKNFDILCVFILLLAVVKFQILSGNAV